MPRVPLAAALSFAASLGAQTLIWPGERLATIDAAHLRAYVPFEHRERLKALVARADHVYAQMIADSGFVPRDKLRLLVADWSDRHNGFSFVAPFPLVQVELAPSLQESSIFAGHGETERTLVHELAHQLSNDRSHGLRRVLENVFGRVLPNDLLSTLVWYLSTPAHQTMPRFWHEGISTWAETAYADPEGAWRGRGRDPLTHMVWRLDAAGPGIPEVADWRITRHEWPFGRAAYVYGTAYTRFLQGHCADRATMWELVATQARSWAFLFDRGPRSLLRSKHLALIERARAALDGEQREQLARLRSAPVTELERLTPREAIVAAPAWLADGTLAFAARPRHGRARLHFLRAGVLRSSWTETRALAPIRATADGALVYHELNWRAISRVELDGDTLGWRLLQPDARRIDGASWLLVAVALRGGGEQALVSYRVEGGELGAEREVAVQGTPWSPALRPGASELAWVETDATGSRLVLGGLDGGGRRELCALRGRILHPVWSADGAHVFFCADHTGVANAWRLTIEDGALCPVTNTIGGVVACVPSPDGTTLALVDHDADGPFLATLANDPAAWAASVPELELAWPAPVAGGAVPQPDLALAPTPPGAAGALAAVPYRGLAELRPLFWAPSTFAVPEGGYGAFALAADPIFSHVLQSGVGAGLVEHEPVAFASWDYLGWPIELGVAGGRSERTFADAVRSPVGGGRFDEFDYTETVVHGAVRAGRGLFALERTLLAYATLGIEDHDGVESSRRDYAGRTLVGAAPFTGTERFVELTLGYDDSTFYPTSYAREDGLAAVGVYRHSGLDGDLERDLAFGTAGYVWSALPAWGHQLVLGGQVGWSDGDDTLQGNFSVGGGLGRGLPRGYFDEAQATGRYLAAGSVGYRFPVFRPFAAATTTPFRGRQLVVELFADSAKVSTDRIDGDGDWFTSVGLELHVNAEVFDAVLSPGLGVAVQLDGEEDTVAYFTLGFGF